MDKLTGDQWKDFIIVGLTIISFVILVGNLIKTIKEWKKPADDLAQWRRDVDTKLERDNKRLNSMEEGINVMCRGMLAIQSHEINGNSVDKLKASQQELTDYLIER